MMPKTRKPFPLYLALLLAVFIAFLAWSAQQAVTDGARITDRDYYSKGLRYNTTQVERRAATVLGWTLASTLKGHTLVLTLQDRDQKPVSDARVSLLLMLPGEQETLHMHETTPGLYMLELPPVLNGEIPARYLVERGGARLEHQLLMTL